MWDGARQAVHTNKFMGSDGENLVAVLDFHKDLDMPYQMIRRVAILFVLRMMSRCEKCEVVGVVRLLRGCDEPQPEARALFSGEVRQIKRWEWLKLIRLVTLRLGRCFSSEVTKDSRKGRMIKGRTRRVQKVKHRFVCRQACQACWKYCTEEKWTRVVFSLVADGVQPWCAYQYKAVKLKNFNEVNGWHA